MALRGLLLSLNASSPSSGLPLISTLLDTSAPALCDVAHWVFLLHIFFFPHGLEFKKKLSSSYSVFSVSGKVWSILHKGIGTEIVRWLQEGNVSGWDCPVWSHLGNHQFLFSGKVQSIHF